jgi:hypothetical protein
MVATNSFTLCKDAPDAGPGIFNPHAILKITGSLIRRRVIAGITSLGKRNREEDAG